MYGYIKGLIKEVECNYIIIDNHDIGYLIYVPNPYYYKLELGQECYVCRVNSLGCQNKYYAFAVEYTVVEIKLA